MLLAGTAGHVSTGPWPCGSCCIQHGIDGDLRIGVARDGDAIDGHAWVEYRGQVLNDAPDVATRFAVFDDDPVGMVFT